MFTNLPPVAEESTGATGTPPPCERCGAATFATTRVMKTHGLQAGKAIPHERAVPVWRCMRCSMESPRQ